MALDTDTLSQYTTLGKGWGAISNDLAVCFISMKVANDVDFDAFRAKVREALTLLGDVKTGEIVEKDGVRYFLQRPNHQRRGKAKPPKIYQFSPQAFI